MVKKNRQAYIILLFVGMIILLATLNTPSREARPKYDGDENEFKIRILSSGDAMAGEDYKIKIGVTNEGAAGKMWVQASILDYNEHKDWLVTKSRSATDNCKSGESFTKTKEVSLGDYQDAVLIFTVEAPEYKSAADWVVFSEAFERCSGTGIDTESSGGTFTNINVVKDNATISDDDNEEDNIKDNPYACKRTMDCPGWFTAFLTNEEVECVSEICSYKEKKEVEKEPIGDLREWATDNKVMLLIIGFALVFVSIFMIYNEPKKPLF